MSIEQIEIKSNTGTFRTKGECTYVGTETTAGQNREIYDVAYLGFTLPRAGVWDSDGRHPVVVYTSDAPAEFHAALDRKMAAIRSRRDRDDD